MINIHYHCYPFLYVSRETMEKLKLYIEYIFKWNKSINLVSPKLNHDTIIYHIYDALFLSRYIGNQSLSIADMGSGSGILGIVLALVKMNANITLIEIDQRKSIFLKEMQRVLELNNLMVINNDIKKVGNKYDIVTAKALDKIENLLFYTSFISHEKSEFFFCKKGDVASEIQNAKKSWDFFYEIYNYEKKATIHSMLKINSLSGKLNEKNCYS